MTRFPVALTPIIEIQAFIIISKSAVPNKNTPQSIILFLSPSTPAFITFFESDAKMMREADTRDCKNAITKTTSFSESLLGGFFKGFMTIFSLIKRK